MMRVGINIGSDIIQRIQRFRAGQLGVARHAAEEQIGVVERKSGLIENAAALLRGRVGMLLGFVVVTGMIAVHAEIGFAIGEQQTVALSRQVAVLQTVIKGVVGAPRGKLRRGEHQRLVAEKRGQQDGGDRNAFGERFYAAVANAARQQTDSDAGGKNRTVNKVQRRAEQEQDQADNERTCVFALFTQSLLHQQEACGNADGADGRADHRLVQQRADGQHENHGRQKPAAPARAQPNQRGAAAAQQYDERQPIPGHAGGDSEKQRQQLRKQRVHFQHTPVGRAVSAGEDVPRIRILNADQPAIGNQLKYDCRHGAQKHRQNCRQKQALFPGGCICFAHTVTPYL